MRTKQRPKAAESVRGPMIRVDYDVKEYIHGKSLPGESFNATLRRMFKLTQNGRGNRK